MGKMLKNIEAEIIYDLYREQGYQLNEGFDPWEIYEGDAGLPLIEAIEVMEAEGTLGVNSNGYTCLTERSLELYGKWAMRRHKKVEDGFVVPAVSAQVSSYVKMCLAYLKAEG